MRIVNYGKSLLRLIYRDNPVPINVIRYLRKHIKGNNPLMPSLNQLKKKGSSLNNSYLINLLSDIELGDWSLGVSALNYLEKQIYMLRPRTILEFGSGISTVCLAHYMTKIHGDSDRIYVFSIDQDSAYVDKTNEMLYDFNLNTNIIIKFVPLRRQIIEGLETMCYDLSADYLQDLFGKVRPDFILIDGPSAEPGTRFATLPLIHNFGSQKAFFFMDDSLRDAEIEIGKLWLQLPYLHVQGISLIEKGIMRGFIR